MKKNKSHENFRCAFSAAIPISKLKPHPKNPHRHNERQVSLLARLIEHHGWRAPIVVSKRSGFIVAGHGRFAAAKELGAKTVPVDYQDFATEKDELAHLVADNRIAELGEIDPVDLSKLLSELEDSDVDLALAGFDDVDLSEIAAEVSLPDPSNSTKDSIAAMADIKAQRKRGNEAIIEKTDTEYYLVVVFPTRSAKEGILKTLGLPEDERYIVSDSVRIMPGKMKSRAGSRRPKASPSNKSGACG